LVATLDLVAEQIAGGTPALLDAVGAYAGAVAALRCVAKEE